ncbi:MAG: Crp/Fnr family transcriptional regulator [Parcubacteria group bacterium]|nr:Crp/Fnr family transcriptional regulator [Parcubacteria group bacterium]
MENSTTTTTLDQLKSIPLLKGLSPDVLSTLIPHLNIKTFAPKTVIYSPFHSLNRLYLLISGKVQIYQIDCDGKRVLLDLLMPGSLFGAFIRSESEMIESDYAEAIEESEVGEIARTTFLDLVHTSSELTSRLFELTFEQLLATRERVKDLALCNAETRIVNQLKRLARHHGTANDQGVVINTRLTHKDIAQMVGLTREMTTKVLGRLNKKGWISFRRGFMALNSKEIIANVHSHLS